MSDAKKLIVNITPQAHNAMNEAARTVGLSRTDVVSLALSLYAQVVAVPSGEGVAYQRPDGTWRHLHITDHQALPYGAEIVEAAQ